ncbi:MAG TPA: FtsQ-type POTRA domain-containing protein [Rhizomicrobium sp.]|jgi:cell division protein FtsQ
MRQVKVTRAAARGGRPSRPGRAASRSENRGRDGQRAASRRKTPSLLNRMQERIRGHVLVRRPMLSLTVGLSLFTLVAAILIGGYVRAAMARTNATLSALIADAGFGISEVHIGGNTRTPPETITAVLGFEPGQSIFSADLRTAREKLLHLPWVAEATVQRRYPDAITVNVIEKLPYALWRNDDGHVYVVERNGSLITDTGLDAFAKLPHLIGADAPAGAAEIVEVVLQHRAIAARMSAYQRVSDRRWNLILDDGVVVELPEHDWQKELATLEHLIIDKGVLERDISEIDLRSKNAIFFMLKSGEQKTTVRGDKA